MGNLCVKNEQQDPYLDTHITKKNKLKKLQQIKQRYQEDQQYIIDENEEKSSRGNSLESSRYTQSSKILIKKIKTLSQYNNSFHASINILDPQEQSIKSSLHYSRNKDKNQLKNAVTSNSYITLKHAITMRNLHSHYVKYETGSRQQEVSACSCNMNRDSGIQNINIGEYDLWEIIKLGNYNILKDDLIQYGVVGELDQKIQCHYYQNQENEHNINKDNQQITINNKQILQEIELNSDNLYSHKNLNQIEKQLEVHSDQILRENDIVVLRHKLTQKYLSSSIQYKSPKQNLQEVCCVEKKNKEIYWQIVIARKQKKNYVENDEYHNCVVRLGDIIKVIHVNSNGQLHTESKKQGLLQGHREVICCHKKDNCDLWAINDIQENPYIYIEESQINFINNINI